MKRNAMLIMLTATAITVMSVVGCGKTGTKEVTEEPAAESAEVVEEATEDTQEALDDASEAVDEVMEEAQDALEEATDGATDALEDAADDLRSPEEELEVLKEQLVYMGGLYISDENNDLMMSIFKNDGLPVVVITKNGEVTYGEFTTEDATLDDGREYTKLLIQDKEFGYHFHLEDEDGDSFLVDEDGTVYDAKDVDESVAMDMVLQTLQ